MGVRLAVLTASVRVDRFPCLMLSWSSGFPVCAVFSRARFEGSSILRKRDFWINDGKRTELCMSNRKPTSDRIVSFVRQSRLRDRNTLRVLLFGRTSDTLSLSETCFLCEAVKRGNSHGLQLQRRRCRRMSLSGFLSGSQESCRAGLTAPPMCKIW